MSVKFCEMLEVTWPLTMLIFRELPSPVLADKAAMGSPGIALGSPPSKASVSVADSPTVTVSRSSVAVKLAARRGAGAARAARRPKRAGAAARRGCGCAD